MGEATISDDGGVSYDNLESVVAWPSLDALATDYWRWQRLSGREKEQDPMDAWFCVQDLMFEGHPAALDVLDKLLNGALTDQERCNVGAGPLEDLLSHGGHGSEFADDVFRRAGGNPPWRTALSCLYLSDDVPTSVQERLGPPSRWR